MLQYDSRVSKFYSFCDAMGMSRSFKYEQITMFYQWYVAGESGKYKLRAWTTLAQYDSAFWDCALDRGLRYPGRRTRKRIKKFINGLKIRYPHTPIVEFPLQLRYLVRIAARIGIRSNGDLDGCHVRDLVFWARILTAHAACIRAVGHSLGMQVRDFNCSGGRAFLTVGRRRKERKLKHRSRVVPLPNDDDYWCAGHVLRVLKRRVHGNARGTTCLFPAIHGNGAIGLHADDWSRMRLRLERLSRKIGITGRIGGRSLRAGGATDYFAVGATRQFVQHQGDWKSDAFLRYDRPEPRSRQYLANVYARRLRSLF